VPAASRTGDAAFNARGSDLLAIGFGTAVAMWSVGYFCRLFGPAVPAPLLFVLMVGCLLAGGLVVGSRTTRGILGGIWCGLIAGLINLLIVGSMISGDTPNSIKAGALVWVPASVFLSSMLCALGAAIGTTRRSDRSTRRDWLGGLAAVAAFATFVLLGAGGLVTGFDEGLAVVDWPNSQGYNMFLYPLARMTGGVYLEHAHRLLGSLVGLTALVLAIHVTLTERRRWVKQIAWATLGGVIVQGILGGLRVTGRLTLSTDPSATAPSIVLAIIHGVFGQMILGALVALAAFRSRLWREPGLPLESRHADTDRAMGAALIVAVIIQLVLGAITRHFTWAMQMNRHELALSPQLAVEVGRWALTIHMTFATLVMAIALAAGARAWGLYAGASHLRRLGMWLMSLMGVQLVLGIAAAVVTANDTIARRPSGWDVAITTLHQIVGAAILACAVLALALNYRLVRPASVVNVAQPAVAAATRS
jgi:cytochrome c oxidase assembly protein subunit 15